MPESLLRMVQLHSRELVNDSQEPGNDSRKPGNNSWSFTGTLPGPHGMKIRTPVWYPPYHRDNTRTNEFILLHYSSEPCRGGPGFKSRLGRHSSYFTHRTKIQKCKKLSVVPLFCQSNSWGNSPTGLQHREWEVTALLQLLMFGNCNRN